MHPELDVAHAMADLLRQGADLELEDDGLDAYLQSVLVAARRLCAAAIDLESDGLASNASSFVVGVGRREVRLSLDLACVQQLAVVLRHPAGVDERDIEVVGLLVAAADEAITHRASHRKADILVADLRTALQSRIVIEQAKGLLAGRHATDLEQAFEWLRAQARNHQRRIRDVAADVVAGRVDPRPE